MYKFIFPNAPYPYPEDVFAHFTAESAGNFTTHMGGSNGAERMHWKDVSGQNHHASVYGTPTLVWDDSFSDGVPRKAVHFKAKAAPGKGVDSIDFPDQSELNHDYSVFAVAGYRKRQEGGKRYQYVGNKLKITRNKWLQAWKLNGQTAELPYSFTIKFDVTVNAHVDKRIDKKTKLPIGRPAVIFVFGQKTEIGQSTLRGRVPAVLIRPLNNTLIVIDGNRHNKHAGCWSLNFPMRKTTQVEIKIHQRLFVVKVNGVTKCTDVRDDRAQGTDRLDQNAKGRLG